MKKLFAISLLLIHLFNLAGYILLFQYFMYRSDQQILTNLNKEKYDDNELVEFKVALNLPYFTDWKDYERRDGEIEINGIHYNYVKMKVAGDTVHLLVLPNKNKALLNNARIEFAKQVNDIPSGKKQNESLAKKSGLFNEFNQSLLHCSFNSAFKALTPEYFYSDSPYSTHSITSDGQPPENLLG